MPPVSARRIIEIGHKRKLSMFARIVSLTLIVAVIACPLSCGLGLCQGGACCLAVVPSSDHCPKCAVSGCCEQSSRDDNEPFQSPCESSCQGICGGAVFEKPCELDDRGKALFSFLPKSRVLISLQQATCQSAGDTATVWSGDAGNYGRFVRTLHGSLIC